MIDNKVITQYVDELVQGERRVFNSYLGLMPAWTGELIHKTENTFIWEMIDGKESNINIPILVCEDDCDLSCIIVMAKIRKTNDAIYWDKLGFLKQENYDVESYNKSGIMNLLSYTGEDWEKYGSNIAFVEYGSYEYWEWVSENWEEETTRRNRNYLYLYKITPHSKLHTNKKSAQEKI